MLASFHVAWEEPPPHAQTAYNQWGARIAQPRQATQQPSIMQEKTLVGLKAVRQHSLGAEMPLEPTKYLQAIVQDVPRVKSDVMRTVHLPLLNYLLPDAISRLANPACHELHDELRNAYSTILTTYLQSYVQTQPANGGGLSRKAVNCKCKQCWTLNLFLASSTEETQRFVRLTKTTREHLQQVLNGRSDVRFYYENAKEAKVAKHDRQAEIYSGWLKRCRTAYNELLRFDAPSLRKIIPLAYDRIMTMEIVITNAARRPVFLPVTLPPMRAPLAATQPRATSDIRPGSLPVKLPPVQALVPTVGTQPSTSAVPAVSPCIHDDPSASISLTIVQPPPPIWLNATIQILRVRYPVSNFEPQMRRYAVDAAGRTFKASIEPGTTLPPGVAVQYLPRIRCNDCAGKLYPAQPTGVTEFEFHLRDSLHRDAVKCRAVASNVEVVDLCGDSD